MEERRRPDGHDSTPCSLSSGRCVGLGMLRWRWPKAKAQARAGRHLHLHGNNCQPMFFSFLPTAVPYLAKLFKLCIQACKASIPNSISGGPSIFLPPPNTLLSTLKDQDLSKNNPGRSDHPYPDKTRTERVPLKMHCGYLNPTITAPGALVPPSTNPPTPLLPGPRRTGGELLAGGSLEWDMGYETFFLYCNSVLRIRSADH